MILGIYSVFGSFFGVVLVIGIFVIMIEEFFGIILFLFVYVVKL